MRRSRKSFLTGFSMSENRRKWKIESRKYFIWNRILCSSTYCGHSSWDSYHFFSFFFVNRNLKVSGVFYRPTLCGRGRNNVAKTTPSVVTWSATHCTTFDPIAGFKTTIGVPHNPPRGENHNQPISKVVRSSLTNQVSYRCALGVLEMLLLRLT